MPVVAAMTVTTHASDAMVAIPFWLEMFAVVAASISGVLVAREHKLDLVGAVALAVVCGLGGGLLRDMTLQVGNVYILNQTGYALDSPANGTPAFHCHGGHHLYFPGNR